METHSGAVASPGGAGLWDVPGRTEGEREAAGERRVEEGAAAGGKGELRIALLGC